MYERLESQPASLNLGESRRIHFHFRACQSLKRRSGTATVCRHTHLSDVAPAMIHGPPVDRGVSLFLSDHEDGHSNFSRRRSATPRTNMMTPTGRASPSTGSGRRDRSACLRTFATVVMTSAVTVLVLQSLQIFWAPENNNVSKHGHAHTKGHIRWTVDGPVEVSSLRTPRLGRERADEIDRNGQKSVDSMNDDHKSNNIRHAQDTPSDNGNTLHSSAYSLNKNVYTPPATPDGFSIATGPSPLDELSLDLPYDALSEEIGGRGSGLFPHMAVDPACPVFVRPRYHDYAGMGHRFSNWIMGLVAALTLNATLLHVPFDYVSKPHGNYSGMDAFLGVGAGEWMEADALSRWPNLTSIDLPRLDNYAPMAKGGMFSPHSRLAIWRDKREGMTRKCHIIFNTLADDWIYDPKPATKWVVAKKWGRNVPSLPNPLRQLQWRASDVNIAVHFRIGDMQPTKEDWHVALLNGTILPVLRAAMGSDGNAAPASDSSSNAGAKIVVHVFMRSDVDHKLFKAFPGLAPLLADQVVFHTADGMTPFQTWLHLTQADVLLQSRSAFSEYAAHVATRPLSFAADGSRFGERYQQCGVGAICCRDSLPVAGNFSSEVPMCPYDARIRLLRMLQRRGMLRQDLMPDSEGGKAEAPGQGLEPASSSSAQRLSAGLSPAGQEMLSLSTTTKRPAR